MFCFFDVKGLKNEDFCFNISENEDEDNFLVDAFSLEHLDVSLCTDLSFMFYNCKNLKNFDFLKEWDVSKNTKFTNMFTFCNFSDVSFLSKWNMKNAEDLDYMFWGCENLKDLTGIQNWKLDKAKLFCRMFGNCKSLTDANALQYWNMTQATDISFMFENCIKLVKIDLLNNWKLDKKVDKQEIISKCKNIKNIVCLQPFACLPNHITAKGVMHSLRENYSNVNVVAIDCDAGSSEANQLNRIKLMMTIAKKILAAKKFM